MSDSLWEPWDPLADDRLLELAANKYEALIKSGMTDRDALAQILDLFGSGLEAMAKTTALAPSLLEQAPIAATRAARSQRQSSARIRQVWGEPLSLLRLAIQGMEELGTTFTEAHADDSGLESDFRYEALLRLHARAVLTARETAVLLEAGFPLGAIARWRTLHELAVVASCLADGSQDLSERYLHHSTAEAARDLRTYPTGEPVGLSEEELLRAADDVEARYGARFKNDWEWAAELTHPERPAFWRLEKLAGLNHLRPHVRAASHHVHAGSTGTDAIVVPFRGETKLLTGSTNAGFVEPGHGACISLLQVTTSLVVHGRPFEYGPMTLATLSATAILVDEVGAAFEQADARLWELEELVQRDLERGAIGAARIRARQVTASVSVWTGSRLRVGRARLRSHRRNLTRHLRSGDAA